MSSLARATAALEQIDKRILFCGQAVDQAARPLPPLAIAGLLADLQSVNIADLIADLAPPPPVRALAATILRVAEIKAAVTEAPVQTLTINGAASTYFQYALACAVDIYRDAINDFDGKEGLLYRLLGTYSVVVESAKGTPGNSELFDTMSTRMKSVAELQAEVLALVNPLLPAILAGELDQLEHFFLRLDLVLIGLRALGRNLRRLTPEIVAEHDAGCTVFVSFVTDFFKVWDGPAPETKAKEEK